VTGMFFAGSQIDYFFHIFICGLYNDTARNSNYTALNKKDDG
jgi:hypothetical protein